MAAAAEGVITDACGAGIARVRAISQYAVWRIPAAASAVRVARVNSCAPAG
jgi:hypothetical protein